MMHLYSTLLCIAVRGGTIHLPLNSILSQYLGADTICIYNFFKNSDFTSFAIRYCCAAILVFNSKPGVSNSVPGRLRPCKV